MPLFRYHRLAVTFLSEPGWDQVKVRGNKPPADFEFTDYRVVMRRRRDARIDLFREELDNV